MRYIRFVGGNGYPVCAINEYRVFSDDYTDSDLDSEAQEMAILNAQENEYVETGWENDWETEEDREAYYENAWCNWQEVTKEEYEENIG